jgi:hypothetical protein
MAGRTLFLTLNKKAFDIMVTGEKKIEYRDPSPWILSRLSKDYDFVKFVNGYGDDRPYFIAKYLKWDIDKKSGVVRIYLGPVVQKGNL